MYQFTKSSNTVTVTSLRFPASSSQATVVSTVPSEKNISYEISEDGESVSIKAGGYKLSPCKIKSLIIDGSTPTSAANFITKINTCFNVPKVYRALLSQSGTDAPVATVLENTIGNITWSYVGIGSYLATLTSAFPYDKTFITTPSQFVYLDSNGAGVGAQVNLVDNINVYSLDGGSNSNGILNNTPIEIRVYN